MTPPQISGFGISPELRFYLFQRRGGWLRKFYVAPYGYFGRYRLFDANYEIDNFNYQSYDLAPFDIALTEGQVDVLGAGVTLGRQWVIRKFRHVFFSIDWGIAGLRMNWATVLGKLNTVSISVPNELGGEGTNLQTVRNQILLDLQNNIEDFKGLKVGSFNSGYVKKIEDNILDAKVKVGMPDVKMYLKVGISLSHSCGGGF